MRSKYTNVSKYMIYISVGKRLTSEHVAVLIGTKRAGCGATGPFSVAGCRYQQQTNIIIIANK